MWSWTKYGSCAALAAGLACFSTARAGTPTLHGLVVDGPVVWLSLRAEDTRTERWVRIGEECDGYRFERWNEAAQTATLRRGDTTIEVTLIPAAMRESATGQAAEIQGVLQNLHQLTASACEWMVSQETSRVSVEDLVAPEQRLQHLEPVAGESYAGLSFTATSAGVCLVMDGTTVRLLQGSDQLAIQAGPTQSLTLISQRLGISLERLAALNPELAAKNRLAEWTSVRLH